MDIIRAYCRTNLDNYDCSEQTGFLAMPNTGDFVRVTYKGNVSRLKIVSITHMMMGGKTGTPYLEIELNK